MSEKPPGSDADLINDLRSEIERLLKCMERAQKMLEVPAAEYVPAITDAWDELQRGIVG